MRRIFLHPGVLGAAFTALVLAGCSDFQDLFSAHPDVAAEAGDVELSPERLAEILALAGGRQRITREAAEFVAGTWVDYALFALAVPRGELPTDSASIAEAVWPEISELKGTHYHDALMADRAAPSDSAADSLYRAKDVRMFQHILFGVKPNAPADQRTATRRKAEGTLTKVKRGANFSVLARELSEDPGSKPDSGYLPPGPRGRFVPAFDSAGWELSPGQVSGLVETPFGFHIIRRPALTDVRERLASYLESTAGARLDSIFMDSLAMVSDIEILGDAPAAMRSAAESPDEARRSNDELVRFKGGALTVQEYLRWVHALPPQYGAQVRQANDSMLRQFAKVLTQNVLLLRAADSAGIRITPTEWAGVRARYLAQLDTLKGDMGLIGPDVVDSTIGLGEREKIAALKLEQYFDRLIAGKARLRPLPSALAGLLRERMPYRIHQAGVSRATEMGQEQRAKADSAAGRGAMQPATGPAPVPGGLPPGATPLPPGAVPAQGAPSAGAPSAKDTAQP